MKKNSILISLITITMILLNSVSVFAVTTVQHDALGISTENCNSGAFNGAYISASDINENDSRITTVHVGYDLQSYDIAAVDFLAENGALIKREYFNPTVDYKGGGFFIPPIDTYAVRLFLDPNQDGQDGYRAVWYTGVDTSSTQVVFGTPTGSNGLPITPSSPTKPTVSGGSLTWPASPSGDGVTGYNIYSDGNLVGNVTGTSYDYNSLPAGSHSITVTSVNPNGESAPSAPVTVTSTGNGSSGGDSGGDT